MQRTRPIQALVGALLAATLPMVPMSRSYAASPAQAAAPAEELTRTQAAALVQKRYAARVVRASSDDEGGRHVYVFRLLSESGKVWIVRIDARSGAELP